MRCPFCPLPRVAGRYSCIRPHHTHTRTRAHTHSSFYALAFRGYAALYHVAAFGSSFDSQLPSNAPQHSAHDTRIQIGTLPHCASRVLGHPLHTSFAPCIIRVDLQSKTRSSRALCRLLQPIVSFPLIIHNLSPRYPFLDRRPPAGDWTDHPSGTDTLRNEGFSNLPPFRFCLVVVLWGPTTGRF